MNCPRCGCDLPADARFCPECGLKLNQRPTDSKSQYPNSNPVATEHHESPHSDSCRPSQPDYSSANHAQPKAEAPYAAPTNNRNEPTGTTEQGFSAAGPTRPEGYGPGPSSQQASSGPTVETPHIPGENLGSSSSVRRNNNGCIIAVVVTVVVLTLVIAVATVSCSVLSLVRSSSHGTSMSNPFNFVHTDHPVTFMIMISGEYDEESSRIPLRITGTDRDGNNVDKTIYLAHSGVDTELPEGTYKAEVVGSPIASNGTIYAIPERVIEFEISESLGPNEPYTLGNKQVFAFAALSPEEMTDELVDDALQWARKDEDSGVDVGKLEEAVRQRRAAATPQEESPLPEEPEQPEGETEPAPTPEDPEQPAEPKQMEEPGAPQE